MIAQNDACRFEPNNKFYMAPLHMTAMQRCLWMQMWLCLFTEALIRANFWTANMLGVCAAKDLNQ